MPGDMSISVNGRTQVSPGFRFHPTEEELLHYYLKKKVSYEKIDLNVILDVDLNKLEPWDIQEKCKIGTTPQNDWYFFSHKDKKYPTGTRTNRATAAGFWEATGRDKTILGHGKKIGMRKTLVFYKGRAPHGQKSDWIMHEYRLDDHTSDAHVCNVLGDQTTQEEGWVVCRIFKKKSQHKTLESPPISSSSIVTELDRTGTQILDEEYPYCSSNNEGADLGQVLEYMGRSSTCKEEAEANNNISPSLESPIPDINNIIPDQVYNPFESSLTNWSALDRLVLNGHTETFPRQLFANFFSDDPSNNIRRSRTSTSLPSNFTNSDRSNNYHGGAHQEYYNQLANSEIDHIWDLDVSTPTRSSSSSDQLCHVSNYSA